MSGNITNRPESVRLRLPRLGPGMWALWVLMGVVVAIVLDRRYAGIPHRTSVGWDYRIFFDAARRLVHAQNPYVVAGYTYTPLLALLMAPLTYLGLTRAWTWWIGVELIAVVVGVAVFVLTEARGRPSWQALVLFAFAFLTAMTFWPLHRIMILGQVDFFVVVLLLFSVWSATRGKPAIRGVFLGLATLLKVWPIVDALVLLQQGLGDRRRAIIAFVCVVCAAPILIVGVGGMSAVRMFVSSTSSQRSYHLVSHSLWGTSNLLFSKTGLARPVMVSNPTRIAVIGVLLVWVIGLMLLTLRTPGDVALCTWNFAACLVLVIPVAHLAYSVFLLPLVWVWGARVLDPAHRSRLALAVFGVLVVWWLLQTHSWPDDHFSHGISAWNYSIVFAIDLVACTVSVLGNWSMQRRASGPALGPAGPEAAAA